MPSDTSVDPRRCWVHGLTCVQRFPEPRDFSSGVSWWECPQCNLATPPNDTSISAATLGALAEKLTRENAELRRKIVLCHKGGDSRHYCLCDVCEESRASLSPTSGGKNE
jgi:hypothetical protein